MTSAQFKRLQNIGFEVVPQARWAKDQPAVTHSPRPEMPRDMFPWVSEDGRRFRACQLNANR